MSARLQGEPGGPSVAAGKWTRAHKVLVGFVAFITIGLFIAHIDVQTWRIAHAVSKNQYDVYLFPCQARSASPPIRGEW